MKHSDALKLITHQTGENSETWADLGAGSGTFTVALADLLPINSKIYALDQDKRALSKIPSAHAEVIIEKIHTDFERAELPERLDGILMANSLHYIKYKSAFLRHYKSYLKPNAIWLIVEYETDSANQWVPYPTTSKKLRELFSNEGYHSFEMLGEYDSVYGRKMYGMKVG